MILIRLVVWTVKEVISGIILSLVLTFAWFIVVKIFTGGAYAGDFWTITQHVFFALIAFSVGSELWKFGRKEWSYF